MAPAFDNTLFSDRMALVIDDTAQAYKGVIPNDRRKEPYMSSQELEDEIDSGVDFLGVEERPKPDGETQS